MRLMPASWTVERKAFQVKKSVNMKAHLVCGRGFQEVMGSGAGKVVDRRVNYSVFKRIKITTGIF